MALTAGQDGLNPTVTVTVTNETGHKLPTGYPEGRRMWLNVKGYDALGGNLLYESGAYNASTAVLTHDADAKIYETQPGISHRLSPIIGLPVGKSFHFVLNDTVFLDNRIPPRGFTNAAFIAAQAEPVAHTYADGQYWDNTLYTLPEDVRFVEVTLYYQGTSKEYVEFLRDENNDPVPNAGSLFYDAWAATGKDAPVAMQTDTISVERGSDRHRRYANRHHCALPERAEPVQPVDDDSLLAQEPRVRAHRCLRCTGQSGQGPGQRGAAGGQPKSQLVRASTRTASGSHRVSISSRCAPSISISFARRSCSSKLASF